MGRREARLEHAFCREPAIQPLRRKRTVDEESNIVREGAAKGIKVPRIERIEEARHQLTNSRGSATGLGLTDGTCMSREHLG